MREIFDITQISHADNGTFFPEVKMQNIWGGKKNIKVIIEWKNRTNEQRMQKRRMKCKKK